MTSLIDRLVPNNQPCSQVSDGLTYWSTQSAAPVIRRYACEQTGNTKFGNTHFARHEFCCSRDWVEGRSEAPVRWGSIFRSALIGAVPAFAIAPSGERVEAAVIGGALAGLFVTETVTELLWSVVPLRMNEGTFVPGRRFFALLAIGPIVGLAKRLL